MEAVRAQFAGHLHETVMVGTRHETLASAAIVEQRPDVLRWLCETDPIAVRGVGPSGRHALESAVRINNARAVGVLAASGFPLDMPCADGESALVKAFHFTRGERQGAVRALLEAGAFCGPAERFWLGENDAAKFQLREDLRFRPGNVMEAIVGHATWRVRHARWDPTLLAAMDSTATELISYAASYDRPGPHAFNYFGDVHLVATVRALLRIAPRSEENIKMCVMVGTGLASPHECARLMLEWASAAPAEG